MKMLVALCAALALTAGTAELVLAQTTEKPGEKPTAKKMRVKDAMGTVKSASADSITVEGKEKGKETEWTFSVDPKTVIRKAGKAIIAADLKAGDPVHVRYAEEDGKAVARSVTVRGGKMARKAAPAEKPETK